MKILITGARGFLGTGAARHAAACGHEVMGVGRAFQAPPGWPGSYLRADDAQCDLLPVLDGFAPDILIHCAGPSSVGASFSTPIDDLRAGILTFANTLDAVRRSSAKPIVLFPSSAAVYGNPDSFPVPESASIRPISPYGFHKAAAEQIALGFSRCYGVTVVICRLFSLLGACQRRLLIWELYRQFAGGASKVVLSGTGEEFRDYLDIEDAASALLGLGTLLSSEHCRGRVHVFNLASGTESKVMDLAALIKDRLGSPKKIVCKGDPRPGDPSRWWANIEKLRAALPNWTPRPVHHSIERCLHQWRKPSGDGLQLWKRI